MMAIGLADAPKAFWALSFVSFFGQAKKGTSPPVAMSGTDINSIVGLDKDLIYF